MLSKSVLSVCTKAALLCAAATSLAVGTQTWTIQSKADYDNGTPKNIAVSSWGVATLAPELKETAETQEPYVWSLVRDAKGALYLGTGNSGKIYRINAEGKPTLLVDTPEVAILTMAFGPDGQLYAGTSPDGLIYKINPEEEKPTPTTILSEGEAYVWSLVFDDAGNLYAATGENGKLFKLSPNAEKPGSYTTEVLYDFEAAHLLCMTMKDGMLYVGSDGNGLIYKVNPAQKDTAFVLYDSEEKEIRSLAFDAKGSLYAVTTSGQLPRPQGGPRVPGPGEKPEVASFLYEISPEGVVRRFWKSPDPLILAFAPYGNDLLVGTGDEGKIYSIGTDGRETLLGKVSEAQVLAILQDASGYTLATGNSGKLFSLSSAYAKEGTWESKALDAKTVASWGSVRWEATVPEGSAVTVQTRSGNTTKPDKTWSAWSDEYSTSEGSKIGSPAARFLQIRLKMTTTDAAKTPEVRFAQAAYLQANVPPEIQGVTVEMAGEAQQGGAGQRSDPRASSETVDSRRTARWRFADLNGDTLQYSVYYKAEGESQWHLLKEEWNTPNYTWDTASMPDGDYRLKVWATDKPSNPPSRALTGELVSDPFRVDNTQPILSDLVATRADDGLVHVTFTATDGTSNITEAAFSLDADKWQMLFPTDDLFDGRTERFDFALPNVPEGTHSVAVLVKDAVGNSITGRIRF